MMYLFVFCMDRYGSIISLNEGSRLINIWGFPKGWFPAAIGFPTKNDHSPPFKETPISVGSHSFPYGKEDTD